MQAKLICGGILSSLLCSSVFAQGFGASPPLPGERGGERVRRIFDETSPEVGKPLPDLACYDADSDTATKNSPTTEDREAETSEKTAVYGFVINMDVEKRILTFKIEAGKEMKVRIAKDVDFRRLDNRPNELKTLEKGHKVRVEYEPSEGEIPLARQLRARVIAKRPKPDSSAESAPRGNPEYKPFKVTKPYRPPIIDAPVIAADKVKDEVRENELVLGVVVSGEARAYPINMLTGPSREIINDTLGETAIAATW